MYAFVLLIASVLSLLGVGQALRSSPAPTPVVTLAVRREETESKPVVKVARQVAVEPVCATTLARFDSMCYGDPALRERLIDCAARRNPEGGRGWAISKAEYDLWRDRR